MWYYSQGQERLGPVTDAEFTSLISAGDIDAATLVWRNGMAAWQPLHEVNLGEPAQPTGQEPVDGAGGESHPCEVCGRFFSTDDLIKYKEAWICPECKPEYFQRLKEGASVGKYLYGGFWIRLLAIFIDGLILWVPIMVVLFGFGVISGAMSGSMPEGRLLNILKVLQLVFSIGAQFIGLVYEVFFIGKYGATPGKMVCGLKVQRPNGERLTYWRALGRYFAKMLSALILYIGFIIAGFDDEKRALHDMICDTRVVRTQP